MQHTMDNLEKAPDVNIVSEKGQERTAKASLLDAREEQLIFVGASIASGCEPCTSHHIKKAKESGLSHQEIREAILNAIDMRKSASKIMKAHAFEQLGEPDEGKPKETCCNGSAKIKELVAIAVAYAVNSSTNFSKHTEAGKQLKISDEEIFKTVQMTTAVKKIAESFVDREVEKLGHPFSQKKETTGECSCS